MARRVSVPALRSRQQTVECAVGAMQLADLTPDDDVDVGLRLDPLDQILGHGLVERPARDQRYVPGTAGEKDRRLSCRISTPDKRDILAGAQVRFERRRPIMNRRALELLQPLDAEAPIALAPVAITTDLAWIRSPVLSWTWHGSCRTRASRLRPE